MDKKTKEQLMDLKNQRDYAVAGFVDAMKLANNFSKELRKCLEALEERREGEIRAAEEMLIS